MKHLFFPVFMTVLYVAPACCEEDSAAHRILFSNVNVWDGTSAALATNSNVLVENNRIVSVGPTIALPEGAVVLDGGGRTLKPGFIEGCVHLNDQHVIGGYNTIELRNRIVVACG